MVQLVNLNQHGSDELCGVSTLGRLKTRTLPTVKKTTVSNESKKCKQKVQMLRGIIFFETGKNFSVEKFDLVRTGDDPIIKIKKTGAHPQTLPYNWLYLESFISHGWNASTFLGISVRFAPVSLTNLCPVYCCF